MTKVFQIAPPHPDEVELNQLHDHVQKAAESARAAKYLAEGDLTEQPAGALP